jgi:hypothetical protein
MEASATGVVGMPTCTDPLASAAGISELSMGVSVTSRPCLEKNPFSLAT